MSDYEKIEELSGGNVSSVFRKGDKVLRERKPDSSNIHQLLQHLEAKGFPYAPKYLGTDEKGREVLSYIEGIAGNYPLPSYMWSDSSLQGIAEMLRKYHDFVSDFEFDETWNPIDLTPLPFEVICHNDFAIYNIIFAHQKPVGVIDFDLAGPGPRIWDIAYALYTCIPLSRLYHSEQGEVIYYDSKRDAVGVKNRIEGFFESYGREIDADVIVMVERRLQALCETMERRAAEGDEAFQKMIDEGHREHYQKDIEFIRNYGHEWIVKKK